MLTVGNLSNTPDIPVRAAQKLSRQAVLMFTLRAEWEAGTTSLTLLAAVSSIESVIRMG